MKPHESKMTAREMYDLLCDAAAAMYSDGPEARTLAAQWDRDWAELIEDEKGPGISFNPGPGAAARRIWRPKKDDQQ